MFLIDSHCHLDYLEYEKNNSTLDDIINNASANDVKFILGVSTTLESFYKMDALIGDRKNIAISCGVHPLNQKKPYNINEFHELAKNPKVIALGETGLDYFYSQDTKLQQKLSFREHIQTGIKLNKPIIIHMRNSSKDTLEIMQEEKIEICGAVLHCFTENQTIASKLLDMGCYISFSGIITFHNASHLHQIVRYIPLERMLIETDSPYLTPVPFRGKKNQPSYLRNIANNIALLKGVNIETISYFTTKNFCDLFKVSI